MQPTLMFEKLGVRWSEGMPGAATPGRRPDAAVAQTSAHLTRHAIHVYLFMWTDGHDELWSLKYHCQGLLGNDRVQYKMARPASSLAAPSQA